MSIVYIETSVVSHAASRQSPDPQIAVLQAQARLWWERERPKYDLVASQLVLNEAMRGDPSAASARMALLAGIPLVPVTDEASELAEALIGESLPEKAAADALHIATAAVAGVQYLLTQNCRHIANAHTLPWVYSMLAERGYDGLLICTPLEFLGEFFDATESDS